MSFYRDFIFRCKLSEQHEGNDLQIESTYDKVVLEDVRGSPKDSRNTFLVETSANIHRDHTLFLSKAGEKRTGS